MNLLEVCRLVDEALTEDLGAGDITTDSVVAPDAVAEGAGPLVLGADTVAAVDSAVIGKPTDRADAVCILTRLSGTTHRVLTGCALLAPSTFESFVATTHVTMRELTRDEIEAYVATGEADGKAGAYAIQETGDRFVR